MLGELRIRNFAVIESAALDFVPGLNVLTGETGAGKSIVVDALTAALGSRTSADVVRTGAGAARVEARFAVTPESAAAKWLAEQGDPGHDLVVAREISADGRSRGWINGHPATVGMLKDLGDLLVEVIGQHESQRLLQPAAHLDLLDAFGGPAQLALRAEIGARVARRTALRAEHRALIEGERERLRRIELLGFQVQEIDAAGLRAGEEESLATRRARLASAERLATATAGAYAALYEMEAGAAVDRLGQARSALRDVAALDPALASIAERIDALSGELSELAHAVADYREKIEDRPGDLAAIEERLALVQMLRRKYGETVEAILAYRDQAAAELEQLDASDARLSKMGPELEALERDLATRCRRLSQLRREAATRLAASMERELDLLEMKRARLSVAFGGDPDPEGLLLETDRVAVGPSGIDRVEFLLAANPGEAPRPLARIASGGELSRVMLALRHVLSAAGDVPVMVCDEVDAGIGARAAGAVGALLVTAARGRQVLVVTHIAQIASLADQHYWVTKDVTRGRTFVKVQMLDGQGRVEEVSRMLSGKLPTAMAKEYAMELLAQARRKRVAGGASKGS